MLPSTPPGGVKAWGSVSAARVGQIVDEVAVPAVSSHAIMVNIGSPFRMEERLDGRLYRTFGNKGDIAVVPAGLPIEFSAREPQEVESFIMYLGSSFVQAIAEREGLHPDAVELIGSVGGHDPRLEQIGLSLLSELENEDVLGGLYAESLATLLAVHLLRSHSSPLEHNLVHLMRFEDGRIAESWFHSRNQYEVDEFWAAQSTAERRNG